MGDDSDVTSSVLRASHPIVTPPQQIMWTVSCICPSNLYILRSLNSSQLTLLRSVLFTICSIRDKVEMILNDIIIIISRTAHSQCSPT